jgi:hypothetical protein
MKNILTERLALIGTATLLSLVVLLHFSILAGIIPFELIWGGRLKDHNQMLRFETVSVSVNLVMLAVIGVKAGFLKVQINPKLISVLLWLMGGLFLLNTLGNLFSSNDLEKAIFTPLTFILAIFCFRLATSKN